MAYKLNQRGYITTKSNPSKSNPVIPGSTVEPAVEVKQSGYKGEAITRTSQGGGRKETGKAATGGEIVKNAVYSGLNQFNKGLFSTLDFLLPTEFLGEHDLISKANDYYSGLADTYGEELEKSTADRSKFVQLGAETLANTAAAVPNAALAVMTGGSSAAAQGSAAALTTASSAAQSGGMLANAANAVQGVVKNPLFWSSMGQNLGNSYEDAKAKGANEWQAIGSAYTSSLLNSALEVGGGVEALPGALKGGKNPFAAWAGSALTEGLEEPVQSTVSGLSDMLFYDKDKPLFSLSDPNAALHPGRMGQEFAMGTAVGGILGAGQLAGNALYMDIPDLLAQHGDYSGYVQEMQEIIDQMQMDELVKAYEKNVLEYPSLQKTVSSDTWIPVFQGQDQYTQWLHSIGAQGTQLDTLEKYAAAKYNNSPEYQLLSGYGKAIMKGDISPLVGFEEYGLTSELIQESVVGTRTPTGVQIESFAPHFIDRVIGQTSTDHPGMRCGVSVEDIVDALENPVEDGPIWRMEDGDIRQNFVGTHVSVLISVRDNRLISTNPRRGKPK